MALDAATLALTAKELKKILLEARIDKIFEELMERDYMISDEYTKRIYRCFFQRYQDASFQKTKERVN